MRPLPAVLLDLHEDLATGKLHAPARPRVEDASTSSTATRSAPTSTPRDETLGHFLVSSGVITEDQHRQAVAARGRGRRQARRGARRAADPHRRAADRSARQAGAPQARAGAALAAGRVAVRRRDRADRGHAAAHGRGRARRPARDRGRGSRPARAARRHELRADRARQAAAPRAAQARSASARSRSCRAGGADRRDREGVRRSRAGADRDRRDDPVRRDRREGRRSSASAPPVAKTTLRVGAMPAPSTTQPRSPTQADRRGGEELFDMLFDDIGSSTRRRGRQRRSTSRIDEARSRGLRRRLDGRARSRRARSASKAIAARQAIAAEHQRDHRRRSLRRAADRARRRRRRHRRRRSQIKLSDARAATPTASPIRATARSSTRSSTRTTTRARCCSIRPQARRVRPRARGRRARRRSPPAIDTELDFRIAEEHDGEEAVGAGDRPPQDRDRALARRGRLPRRARLGRVEWRRREHAEAADAARDHLNHALVDQSRSRGGARLQGPHRGRAAHRRRRGAVPPRARDRSRSGAHRRARRRSRRCSSRAASCAGSSACSSACCSGCAARAAPPRPRRGRGSRRLYLDHLDDPRRSAPAAIANARKIAPQRSRRRRARRAHRAARARTRASRSARGWREALGDPQRRRRARQRPPPRGHADAAFLAASTMVALGTADDAMAALYEQHRVRGVDAAEARRSIAISGRCCATRTTRVELGALIELVAPAVHALAPMTLADSDLDAEPAASPTASCRPRSRGCATQLGDLLGVGADAPVYARVELGSQIHVVACRSAGARRRRRGADRARAPRARVPARARDDVPVAGPRRRCLAPGPRAAAVVLAIVREAVGHRARRRRSARAARAEQAVAALPAAVQRPGARARRCACCRAAAAASTCRCGRARCRAPRTAPACCCAATSRRRSPAPARSASSTRISWSSRTAPRTSPCARSSACRDVADAVYHGPRDRSTSRAPARRRRGDARLRRGRARRARRSGSLAFIVVAVAQDRAVGDARLAHQRAGLRADRGRRGRLDRAPRARAIRCGCSASGSPAAALVLGWFLMLAIVVGATAVLMLILHTVM